MNSQFEVFKDKKGEWRFNLKAKNGEIISTSEGYSSKQGCLKGIASVQANVGTASIEVEGEEMRSLTKKEKKEMKKQDKEMNNILNEMKEEKKEKKKIKKEIKKEVKEFNEEMKPLKKEMEEKIDENKKKKIKKILKKTPLKVFMPRWLS